MKCECLKHFKGFLIFLSIHYIANVLLSDFLFLEMILTINTFFVIYREEEITRKITTTKSAQLLSTQPKRSTSVLQKMAIALDNPRRGYQNTSTTDINTNSTTNTTITADQHLRNGVNISADDDPVSDFDFQYFLWRLTNMFRLLR